MCQNEALEAECAHDEVVLMERALYGRMRVSRCVDRNYGYIPCVDDVLRNADVICSGLQTCKIPIPTTAFDKWVSSCPKDFKSYLEASYQCVKSKYRMSIFFLIFGHLSVWTYMRIE